MPSANYSTIIQSSLRHWITVGISESAVSNNQSVTLITHSLGSCIGVTVYDPKAKVGGLLHYILPDATIDQVKAKTHPSIFGSTGIPTLIHAVCAMNGEKDRLIITVSGGAQIFYAGHIFNIGQRNYDMAIHLFKK